MCCQKEGLIFIFLCCNLQSFDAISYIKFTKIECKSNPKFLYNHSCHLKALNRYQAPAYMQTVIKKPLNNVTLNGSFHVRNYANVYNPRLINATGNLCQTLNKGKMNAYGRMLLKLMLKESNTTNAIHPCPFEGMVFAQNFYIDSDILPLPKQNYKLLLQFYEGYPLEFLGSIAFYAEIVEAKDRKRIRG